MIVTGDADPVAKKVLRESETRIDFDLGLTIDTEHGAYLDGGSRLSTTIAVNKSVKGLRVQTVAIALAPRSAPEGAAELQLDTTTAFSLSLGPLKLTVDGIGATVALGTTKGEVPENAARLMGKFLYIGDVGFRPPKGIGIVVDGEVVTRRRLPLLRPRQRAVRGRAAALARQALDADRDRPADHAPATRASRCS